MKVNLLSRFPGNAITRQYKRNKYLTYMGSAATGACLGAANLFHAAKNSRDFLIWGTLGLVFLKNTIEVFSNLLKLAKPYDAIWQRANKIYKHK